ncbi:MAG: hypothetical protein U9N53_12140, partial [Bacteroidota bacterium]|nr:hypothetical protein [Bacteroidota bacterium]
MKLYNKIFFMMFLTFLIGRNGVGQESVYLKALAGVQEEEYVEAIKLFDQLITNNKSDYGLFMQRGESYYLMDEYQQAVEDFHRAEALQTDCSAF